MNLKSTSEMSPEAASLFQKMVQSVGVKRFAGVMGLSTRQINRMLAGAQPNPVERMVRCLQSCEADVGDEAISFVCQEAGGWFIKDEGDPDRASVNAVRECAQAIEAIADGEVSLLDEQEIRDAICALTALLRSVQQRRRGAAEPREAPQVTTRRGAGSVAGTKERVAPA